MHKITQKPLVLCILDGWGHTTQSKHNAIKEAHTPTWDRWAKAYPEILLDASGPSVGLPEGQMGNSEVGHTTIGTGRVVPQDLPRIHNAIKDESFAAHEYLNATLKTLESTQKAVHVMGLFSEGGVHSHRDHIYALIRFFGSRGVKTYLHLFLDGRDTPPQSAEDEMKKLLDALKDYPSVSVATIGGRFYGMDRDNRWDRTETAFQAIVHGRASSFGCPTDAISKAYKEGITDEFITPQVDHLYKGMHAGDAWIMANFRADRVRQLLHALTDKTFSEFNRGELPEMSHKLGMKGYSSALETRLDVLFPPFTLNDTLGEVLSNHKKTQLRIAETEKYAHVTFFFNGGTEAEFPHEKRTLIPSPKVKTYDLKPEMSAQDITDVVVKDIETHASDVIIMNYANTDMVGHTGKMAPTIKAVETVDQCLAQLEKALLSAGGILFVTADHGNAETMENPKTHQPHTAHTVNPVPFVCVTNTPYTVTHAKGTLADVAPTLLHTLGLDVPKAMTGKGLLSW